MDHNTITNKSLGVNSANYQEVTSHKPSRSFDLIGLYKGGVGGVKYYVSRGISVILGLVKSFSEWVK